MKTLPLVVLALSALVAYADNRPDSARPTVEYRIRVRLDTAAKRLHGQEQITWRNPSRDSVDDLWFHLYLNAFKNFRTTFYKNRGPASSRDSTWGWIDVLSLRLPDGTDLTKGMSFEQPDDGNLHDQTVLRVRLPQPVPPGGSITLSLAFLAQLPDLRIRTGHSNGTFMVAQWFPKLGVYEPAGVRGRATGGWNCHQFHRNTEFYADFGRYSVEITVPSSYRIGATGRLQSRKTNDQGESVYLYEEDNIHDFAWTAGPHYVVVNKRFSGRSDVSESEYHQVAALLDRSVDDLRLSDVELIFLMQPGHLDQLSRYEEAVRLALKWYGLWYGPYPYATLTIVDPVAPGGGGMEYPTLITAGTLRLFSYWPFDRIRFPEIITVHEVGHQWWYGMVANNEFEEAWLDEGINSYSTGRVMEERYGKRGTLVCFLGFELSELDLVRMQNTPSRIYARTLQPAWSYHSGYSFYTYRKPQLMLRTLENYLGRQTMARIMRTYHERWRFGHPVTEDFIGVVNEISRRDMSWFLNQALRETSVFDYEIADVVTYPIPRPRGVFDSADGKVVEPEDNQEDTKQETGYRSEVLVRRNGAGRFPVDILLTFEDGRQVEKQWDGNQAWTRFCVDYKSRLARAEVDPKRVLELDVNWANNGRKVDPDSRPAVKIASHVVFWFQCLLALFDLMG
ncbi:MAG TPA: M1 family metallopeptidase [Acidobacteriota bacterium]|nr:M1 family metallopeptidase [Acidobacteriota bacterium]